MPDVRDMTETEAADALKEQSLSYVTEGNGLSVTGQIPAPGELLPGDSTVILYMGQNAPTEKIRVPNLKNLTPDRAYAVMENSGQYLQTKGSSQHYSVVTDQEPAPGSEVPRGTTVTVELTDQTALDTLQARLHQSMPTMAELCTSEDPELFRSLLSRMTERMRVPSNSLIRSSDSNLTPDAVSALVSGRDESGPFSSITISPVSVARNSFPSIMQVELTTVSGIPKRPV
jgi:hypothetical protein